MNGFNNFDTETLLQYAALSGAADNAEDFSSDYDEDSFYGHEAWDDDDDDDTDEGFYESSFGDEFDDDEDEFESYNSFDGEARKRRGRRTKWRSRRMTKLRPVRGRKTTVLRGANGQAMQVKFGGKGFVTPQQFNKAVAKTEQKFKQQQKIAKGNFDKLASQVASNSRQMKKLQESAQSSQLMSMLNQGPEIKSMKIAGTPTNISDVKYNSSSNNMLLPLMMSGGLGGDDSSQMMMLMMMMNQQQST